MGHDSRQRFHKELVLDPAAQQPPLFLSDHRPAPPSPGHGSMQSVGDPIRQPGRADHAALARYGSDAVRIVTVALTLEV
jgi:hypothetical protein